MNGSKISALDEVQKAIQILGDSEHTQSDEIQYYLQVCITLKCTIESTQCTAKSADSKVVVPED